MSKIRVLSSKDIDQLYDLDQIIDAVQVAYEQKSKQEGTDFPLIFHEFNHGVADMDIKSGALNNPACFGLKVVSFHQSNPSINLPALMSTTMIFDSITGQAQGLINFEKLTGIRTAAAATIGAMLLSKKDSKNFLMVGCGHLSTYIVKTMNSKFSNLEKIMIYDPINIDNAYKLQAKLLESNIDVEVVMNIEQATINSDIIITATPSKEPIIKAEWVKPGTHLSCIGADMSGKNEVDYNLLKDAKLYIDDKDQSINVGEFEMAYKNNIISDDTNFINIGKVIYNEKVGRLNNEEITIFDSTGISLQDIMVSKVLLDKAEQLDIGVEIDF